MSNINVTSSEAQRFGEQEDGRVEKSKDFLTSSLRWSFALFGAKDFLMNEQVTFIGFSVALIAIFGISSRTPQSDCGTTLINFVFLMLGYLVVGIAIDSIVLNPYIKWVIYAMFIALVAINPNHQQTFLEMKQILKPMCRETFQRLGSSCGQVREAIQNRLEIIFKDQEESLMGNNPTTQLAGGGGGVVGEDNV